MKTAETTWKRREGLNQEPRGDSVQLKMPSERKSLNLVGKFQDLAFDSIGALAIGNQKEET